MSSQTQNASAKDKSSETSSTPASADVKPSASDESQAAPPAEEVDNRPAIVKLLEKMGVVKDAKFQAIHTADGRVVETCTVRQILGSTGGEGYPAQLAIIVKEDGIPREHTIRWEQIVSFVR